MKKKVKFSMMLVGLCLMGALLTFMGCDGDGCDQGIPQLPAPPAPGNQDCLNYSADFDGSGPFGYDRDSAGNVEMWVPEVPSGCQVPIIHLANGTGASCSMYGSVLARLATHGFMAVCYDDANTGYGTQCLEAVTAAIEDYPGLVSNKVGFTGHSQGGGAAFICTARAEQQWSSDEALIAGHAIEPASGFGDAPSDWEDLYEGITSPMFMFNGSADVLVSASWVRDAFNTLNNSVEAYWYEAQGATHIPIPTSWSQESAVAWFRWKLLGDEEACEYFKNMPDTYSWDYQDSQNETPCN